MLNAIGDSANTDSILRLPEVETLTGLKRTAIYERMANRTFPSSVSLGVRHVGWRHSDLREWLNDLPSKRPEQCPAEADLGISSRIRRSEGRTPRSENANARLTRKELELLKSAASSEGKALGEWTRDVLLAAANSPQKDLALFTELTALRLLLTNVLRPIAQGETMTPETFQAIQAGVRKDKHDAAQQVLAQYQPKRTEEG